MPLCGLDVLPRPAEDITGLLIVLAALAIGGAGFVAFRRAGTNVNPLRPALSVVRGGLFRLTRNPMYLCMVMLLVGLALIFANTWGLVGAAVLWAALHWGAVRPEGRYLEIKFGAAYRALLAETRRWL